MNAELIRDNRIPSSISDLELRACKDSCLMNIHLKKYGEASERLATLCKMAYTFKTTKVDEVNEVWVFNNGIYVPNGKSVIRELCRGILGEFYTEYIVNLVISKIETDSFIDQDTFFNYNTKNEIAVGNGILNLKTRELAPFNSDKIFFNKINANYVPGAICDMIDTFLSEVLPDRADVNTIYELFGYCLWKEYFIEKGFMLLGNGRNGKGKVLSILKHFLGDGNVAGIPLQKLETGEFKEYGLLNKLANVAGDISNYPLKETNKFKGLTGRDIINASRKFKTDVSFVNYAKLIFATNHLPKTYDLSVGFFDRWVYITFPYTFKPQIEYDQLMLSLSDDEKKMIKLMDDHRIDNILDPDQMSGLLNAALDGLDRLFANHSFTSSKSGEETKNFWIKNSDSFLSFVLEYIEHDANSYIEKEDLRKRYQLYCKKNNVMSEGDKHIREILVRHFTAGEERKGSNPYDQTRAWTGIRFKGPIKNNGVI